MPVTRLDSELSGMEGMILKLFLMAECCRCIVEYHSQRKEAAL